jgi:hypothetical protein
LEGFIFYAIGVRFDVRIPSGHNISGFEIVRCKRGYSDSYTITQGIVGLPERVAAYKEVMSDPVDTANIYPNGFMTTSDITWEQSDMGDDTVTVDNNYLMFASPEYCY